MGPNKKQATNTYLTNESMKIQHGWTNIVLFLLHTQVKALEADRKKRATSQFQTF